MRFLRWRGRRLVGGGLRRVSTLACRCGIIRIALMYGVELDGNRVFAGAQRLLDARIVFDHVHAERVERADRVEFVDERVHDDEVLVTVL